MSKKYGLLLDFDGIVVDSEPIYEKAMTNQFARFGIEVKEEDWLFFKGKDSKSVFAYLRNKFNSGIDHDALYADYKRDLFEGFQKELSFIPGFLDFFHACKKDFQDILVTSTSREVMQWIFTNVSIVENIFSHMITANEVQNTKPHPEPYIRAAKHIGIPIERCVVLEDSLIGVRAGKASGARVLALTSSFLPEVLKEADLIVNNYSELSPQRLIDLIHSKE